MDHTNSDIKKSSDAGSQSHEEKEEPEETVSLLVLYSYLPKSYYYLCFIGVIASICSGLVNPGSIFIFREIYKTVGSRFEDREGLSNRLHDICIWLAVAAAIQLVSCAISFLCFKLIGNKLQKELAARYLKSLMTQDQEYFDSKNIESLPTEVSIKKLFLRY